MQLFLFCWWITEGFKDCVIPSLYAKHHRVLTLKTASGFGSDLTCHLLGGITECHAYQYQYEYNHMYQYESWKSHLKFVINFLLPDLIQVQLLITAYYSYLRINLVNSYCKKESISCKCRQQSSSWLYRYTLRH